eukprot:52792_1
MYLKRLSLIYSSMFLITVAAATIAVRELLSSHPLKIDPMLKQNCIDSINSAGRNDKLLCPSELYHRTIFNKRNTKECWLKPEGQQLFQYLQEQCQNFVYTFMVENNLLGDNSGIDRSVKLAMKSSGDQKSIYMYLKVKTKGTYDYHTLIESEDIPYFKDIIKANVLHSEHVHVSVEDCQPQSSDLAQFQQMRVVEICDIPFQIDKIVNPSGNKDMDIDHLLLLEQESKEISAEHLRQRVNKCIQTIIDTLQTEHGSIYRKYVDVKRIGNQSITELNKQLKNFRKQIENVPGDGNCLFHAAAQQLNRKHISFDNYTQVRYNTKMAKDGKWGGHHELVAISKHYRVLIKLYKPFENPQIINGIGDSYDQRMDDSNIVEIGYVNDRHYVQVTPINPIDNSNLIFVVICLTTMVISVILLVKYMTIKRVSNDCCAC